MIHRPHDARSPKCSPKVVTNSLNSLCVCEKTDKIRITLNARRSLHAAFVVMLFPIQTTCSHYGYHTLQPTNTSKSKIGKTDGSASSTCWYAVLLERAHKQNWPATSKSKSVCFCWLNCLPSWHKLWYYHKGWTKTTATASRTREQRSLAARHQIKNEVHSITYR